MLQLHSSRLPSFDVQLTLCRSAAMSALFTMLHQDNLAAQQYNLTPDDFALACASLVSAPFMLALNFSNACRYVRGKPARCAAVVERLARSRAV